MTRSISTALRIAHLVQSCRTLGPGARTVVWVRGCARRCPGCIATPILGDGPALELPADEVAARVVATSDEGVTFSGGEPFEQAGALAVAAAALQDAGRSVMVYTGFALDELRTSQDTGVQALLAATDILVDGPFDRERTGDLLWRGSENQRIHLLTERYAHLASRLQDPGAGVEMRFDADSNVFWAGVPEPGFVARLQRAAESRGLALATRGGIWA